ncbi:cob(I)yrinic acid a,c-diamide adenosyltransferase [Pararobbsia alpina]|uniref:Cobalamin adenosyltransferase n=1 Tax=Pararobbsia alpina TaxID=621374 RepID=A0A6S7AU19_9BURK|nr:cob(I)yrinic acid a,c-diamide adenosyltransferase [Pararobbsia alpina]CAB3777049.1 Cobalamin adenosyltransferase [Pararobbsia alpina]
MGHRLSKIATRGGDDGSTGLGDGKRLSKGHARIGAIGEVDELNSNLGVLLCEVLPDDVRGVLTRIQHDLFDLGGELCMPGHVIVRATQVEQLDGWLEHYNATLEPLAEFILPGGSRAASLSHVCRTVCRRAERSVVILEAQAGADSALLRQYLNRLSDLLFVLARVLNRAAGGEDVLWKNEHRRG